MSGLESPDTVAKLPPSARPRAVRTLLFVQPVIPQDVFANAPEAALQVQAGAKTPPV
jgi:hypothetical protein